MTWRHVRHDRQPEGEHGQDEALGCSHGGSSGLDPHGRREDVPHVGREQHIQQQDPITNSGSDARSRLAKRGGVVERLVAPRAPRRR